MSIDANKQLVRTLYEQCFNHGSLELLNELLTEDFVASPGNRGRAEFAAGVAAIRAGFPDVRFELEEVFGEDERLAVRWTFQATHAGAFNGTPATGRRVTQTGNVLYHFRGGRIARAWVQVDRLGLLQQIGALPT
ncbi:ester cyclase [Pseudoduganella namucuonensis]|uniref:Ester cyclase n=1 Tax=Pseudoduganella namucuonensis TaxID=1035707 RepID=A0A1I7LTE0_9BURK|nr:ester cyclase [Pseudoduganella namucuonensis]SFV12918.1 conserved hypothetical protein, steroid delta-isomerase-related [Pseudoduganella namucuonensis]